MADPDAAYLESLFGEDEMTDMVGLASEHLEPLGMVTEDCPDAAEVPSPLAETAASSSMLPAPQAQTSSTVEDLRV